MVRIDWGEVGRVAKVLREKPERDYGLNFYSFKAGGKEIIADDMYPSLGGEEVINFFFAVVTHDYGFWHSNDKGYTEPLYGRIGAGKKKGSDFLFTISVNKYKEFPNFFLPENLSKIMKYEFLLWFSDDQGLANFQDYETRIGITRDYGTWFLKNNLKPKDIVSRSNSSKFVLRRFMELTRQIPGYNRDSLLKKNLLLAMALSNRPEKFLRVNPEDFKDPIIDYHLMRLALRLGLVEIINRDLERKITSRSWVSEEEENSIRRRIFTAIKKLIELSGKPMKFVDEKMWRAREYCPEMEKPDCSKCEFGNVCKKRKDLFQPVWRTNNY